jgi:hypothetical protein
MELTGWCGVDHFDMHSVGVVFQFHLSFCWDHGKARAGMEGRIQPRHGTRLHAYFGMSTVRLAGWDFLFLVRFEIPKICGVYLLVRLETRQGISIDYVTNTKTVDEGICDEHTSNQSHCVKWCVHLTVRDTCIILDWNVLMGYNYKQLLIRMRAKLQC